MKSTPAPTTGRRRVVIYCRISDDREGRKYGVDRQEAACRKRADQLGWEVVEVLIENDISAYSGKIRPKYVAMMEMLSSGRVDAVLALTSRRLQRRFRDAFDFLDLVEAKGIAVVTVKGGSYDLTTADGRREARRKAIDDQHESEEIGERVQDAKRDNVREGTYRGGGRPFGYEADGMTARALLCPACGSTEGFTADRKCEACGAAAVNAPGSEAWHVEATMDAIIAGDALRSLGRGLNELGIRPAARRGRLPDGTRSEPIERDWEPSTLRQMLLRPRNAGLMEVAGEIVGRAAWPGLVTEEKWRACKGVLEDPKRRTTPGPARRWLGSNLYRCGFTDCMSRVIVSAAGSHAGRPTPAGGNAVYRCKTGGHVTRRAAVVDDYVERIAVERLSREDAVALLLPARPGEEPTEVVAARANELRTKLDQYAADYDDDLITRKQMLDGTARTRARLAEVEAGMAQRATVPVLSSLPLGTPDIRELWPKYSLDRKRAIIDAILIVTILPGRAGRPPGHRTGEPYFNPETVRVEPRPAGQSHLVAAR